MRRWFLSYHSPDQARAEQLKAAVERKDDDSKVFFAPQKLRAGRLWSKQLADEIAHADAFILLIAEKGIGGWQELEYDEALDKWVASQNKSPGFPLIVVLLEGEAAPGLPFLRRMHWIVDGDPSSDTTVGRIFDAAAGRDKELGELWRHTSPYRGLEAMEERDSEYFFGRTRETIEGLNALATPSRLPIFIGNSGVGKSSLVRAGVLAALKRQAWPDAKGANEWPVVFHESRKWCFLSLRPGTDPIKALVDCFLDIWPFDSEFERVKERNGWIELLLDGAGGLTDLLEATERHRGELQQSKPTTFLLYVDQGEELYIRSEERQQKRFSELIAQALPCPYLRITMSLRSDFLGYLQKDQPLFNARCYVEVAPLREAELREIVSRPAQLLGARFENERLVDIVTQRAAEDSLRDVGALPLLSYTLDDMWTQMVRRDDGMLRLPVESFELGGVLVGRASVFLASHPGDQNALRRILTLRLATVREDGEPTRRRANKSEFTSQEWRLVSELAGYPNRLLIVVTTEDGSTFAEVAHEAIFRRWEDLRKWITSEREFLIWRSSLEMSRRTWEQTPEQAKGGALLMGLSLTKAADCLSKRKEDLSEADGEFINQSIVNNSKENARARLARALILTLLVATMTGLTAWTNQNYIKEQWVWYRTIRPFLSKHVWPFLLPKEEELALEAGRLFKECTPAEVMSEDSYCPEMVVLPADSFWMGPEGEKGDRSRQHPVTIQKFAVSKFELRFDEWNTCVTYGGCNVVHSATWGEGRQPVINVTWEDARQYAAWLSKVTERPYRLLTEAEYEYAARAKTDSRYPWGTELGREGKEMANCDGCGSKWDNTRPAPVGSFEPNAFGLHDMIGNVWEWVADCHHRSFEGAPNDGSAWLGSKSECAERVVRGGAWDSPSRNVRSSHRYMGGVTTRNRTLGFRVARTLSSGGEAAASLR